MPFVKAARHRAYLKAGLTGPSGSGKTMSALRLAFGLGGKIAVIDSENGSASLYAHLGLYDVLEISAPFTVQKYIAAIGEAVEAGYDVLILDSISHVWAGDGGLLAQKEALDARGGNSFTNWASITKQHEAFKTALLQSPIHTLVTIRSKTEYVVEQGQGGKTLPRKVGLAPVQRDGFEYELTVVLDIASDHSAVASKDRTGLFEGLNARLTEEHGRLIGQWLAGAKAPESRGDRAAVTSPPADETANLRRALRDEYGVSGKPADPALFWEWLSGAIGHSVSQWSAVTPRELEVALAALRDESQADELPLETA